MILLTGSTGYIGSHISHIFEKNKIKYIGIDNLSKSSINNLVNKKRFLKLDYGNENEIIKFFANNSISSVIHCAAYAYVLEGEKKKKIYFNNNVKKTKKFINECIKKKINIVPVPGVSSITSAMSVSGFKDQFLFYGFLPKKQSEIDKILSKLSKSMFTQIFFVPALKINFYLKYFKKYYSERKIMIAREMTKIHETFYREDINKFDLFKKDLKGELTIVISETNIKDKTLDTEITIKKIRKYLKKYSLKDTVDLIMQVEKRSKKEIYNLCLSVQNEKNL